MRVAIIGTGYLGRTVASHFKSHGANVIHTYRTQKYFANSIQFDLFSQNLSDLIPLADIDVIVFTSMIEDSPDTDAVLRAMRYAFSECKDKRVVYVSTDAVFDGQKGGYVEMDLPTPINTYGKHKKLCEEMLGEIVPDFCIVRTSYIYGFSLDTLDNRLKNAQTLAHQNQIIKKFVDMFKSPTEVNQLAEIIATVSGSNFNGIVHACGKRLSVYEFFRQALIALGEQTDSLESDYIPDIASSEYLVDTSLDSTFLKNKFGFEAVPIETALNNPGRIPEIAS